MIQVCWEYNRFRFFERANKSNQRLESSISLVLGSKIRFIFLETDYKQQPRCPSLWVVTALTQIPHIWGCSSCCRNQSQFLCVYLVRTRLITCACVFYLVTVIPKRCDVNNGGCMHFCESVGNSGAKCLCATGYRLLENGFSCEPEGTDMNSVLNTVVMTPD